MTDATQKGVSDGSADTPDNADIKPEQPQEDHHSDAVFDTPEAGGQDASQEIVDGADTSDRAKGDERPRNPRDDIIDGVHANVEAQRIEEIKEGGLSGLQPMHQPEPELEPDPLPDEVAGHPLADYAVMKDGAPMFKTVVDGTEVLVPFDKAQATLQKHEAAEVRLARAAEIEKGLNSRATQLLATEQALQAREQNLRTNPPPTGEDDQGMTDDQIAEMSTDLAKSFMTEGEDKVAAKLAKAFKSVRTSPNQGTPVIDPDAIGRQAVVAAKQELAAEQQETNINNGYKKFVEDYSDIAGDENLFRYADSLTDQIAVANPESSPEEVMLEAGKQTRAWVESMKAPAPSADPNGDRQSRKDELVPLPQADAASARQEKASDKTPEQTPQDAFADIRKSRGQAM